jgi:DNA-binding transcriptional ArsR family regulator
VSDIFEAISAPVRRAILDELVERDGQTLFELCSRLAMKHHFGVTRQAVSQHLDVLESAGLVTTVRQGKYKLHYLHAEPLRVIFDRWLSSGAKGARE